MNPIKDQHILIDNKILDKMVMFAHLQPRDTVLEIGGGPGNLTEKILEYGCKVIVVEKDEKYINILFKKFKNNSKVTIIGANILEIRLPYFTKLISNLPYSILEPFFFKLIKERKYIFDIAIVSLPEGFIKRIVVSRYSSKFFGVISVLFNFFFNITIKEKIPKDRSYPIPRVNSYIVELVPKNVKPVIERRIDFIVQNLFLYDEKKIKNVLLKLFWDYGKQLTGTNLTKRQAKTILTQIFNKKLLDRIGDKKIYSLSNHEMREFILNLLCGNNLKKGRRNSL